jgi:hypothetical protein
MKSLEILQIFRSFSCIVFFLFIICTIKVSKCFELINSYSSDNTSTSSNGSSFVKTNHTLDIQVFLSSSLNNTAAISNYKIITGSNCPSRKNIFFIFSADTNSSFDSLTVKCAIKSACLLNRELAVYIVSKHYPAHLFEWIPSVGCRNLKYMKLNYHDLLANTPLEVLVKGEWVNTIMSNRIIS